MNQPVGMTHSDHELEAMRAIVEVLGHPDEAARELAKL